MLCSKKTELLPKAKPSQKQQNLDKNTNLFRKIKYQNKNSLSNFYVKFIQQQQKLLVFPKQKNEQNNKENFENFK